MGYRLRRASNSIRCTRCGPVVMVAVAVLGRPPLSELDVLERHRGPVGAPCQISLGVVPVLTIDRQSTGQVRPAPGGRRRASAATLPSSAPVLPLGELRLAPGLGGLPRRQAIGRRGVAMDTDQRRSGTYGGPLDAAADVPLKQRGGRIGRILHPRHVAVSSHPNTRREYTPPGAIPHGPRRTRPTTTASGRHGLAPSGILTASRFTIRGIAACSRSCSQCE